MTPAGASTTRNVLLLVNPTAGRGRALRLWPAVDRALRDDGHTTSVHIARSLTDAERAARAADSSTIVAVLGGDGFLGAAAAGARESSAVLLPLAGGRGNDNVRRLGLPLDPVVAVGGLARLDEIVMDLGMVNGRPFFGVVNVGLDGVANEHSNRSRLNLGPLIYVYGGVRALFEWRDVAFTLAVDSDDRTFTGWFVAVGNVGQYGGGMRICPDALADDGQLDVVFMGRTPARAVIATFLRSYKGKHLGHPRVTQLRGHRVRIAANKPLNVYADGEKVGPLPADVHVLPGAIKVLVPPGSPVFRPVTVG
ncbi:diacylglycerol kinase family protein [Mycetocola sp. 2940]|uniref:diacylglycerol/lipid kinase family protein n=1 Tax=Mycetocola sp. 2940 TaxID=3156452 RepID=UPI0033957426